MGGVWLYRGILLSSNGGAVGVGGAVVAKGSFGGGEGLLLSGTKKDACTMLDAF